jgi:hypothetical protein
MAKNLELNDCKGLVYYGNSDLLAQIAEEITCNPTSCLSKNLLAWYDMAYANQFEFNDCKYQVEINQELCETKPPATLTDVIELISAFMSNKPRRIARAALRIICREALRRITETTAPPM